jgi:hypothetical protein
MNISPELLRQFKALLEEHGDQVHREAEGMMPFDPVASEQAVIDFIEQNFIPVAPLIPAWNKAKRAYMNGGFYDDWHGEMEQFWKQAGTLMGQELPPDE